MSETDDFFGTMYFNGEPLGKVTKNCESVPVTVHADELKIVTKKPDEKYRELHFEYSVGDKKLEADTFATWDEFADLVSGWFE